MTRETQRPTPFICTIIYERSQIFNQPPSYTKWPISTPRVILFTRGLAWVLTLKIIKGSRGALCPQGTKNTADPETAYTAQLEVKTHNSQHSRQRRQK